LIARLHFAQCQIGRLGTHNSAFAIALVGGKRDYDDIGVKQTHSKG